MSTPCSSSNSTRSMKVKSSNGKVYELEEALAQRSDPLKQMTLPSLSALSLGAPTAMLAGAAVSLWDELPPDIEAKIAKLVCTMGPPKEDVLELRLLREAFADELYPIHLVYKNQRSPDHAMAFVKGVLLMLEISVQHLDLFGRLYMIVHDNSTVYVRGHAGNTTGVMNHAAGYYNELGENITAMLQKKEISLAKFQPDGWRVQSLRRIFRYVDRYYVKRHNLATVMDMVNNTVSAYKASGNA